jgi:hypothetical protein
VGAPLPVALADEGRLLLAYLPEVPIPGWDGSWTRVVDLDTTDPVVLVRLTGVAAWQWGPPNDEAFQGHPLADRGLRPYGVFHVEGSSWIRQLEQMNWVHPQHRPEVYGDLTHLVFTFHDSTLEAITHGFTAEPRRSNGGRHQRDAAVALVALNRGQALVGASSSQHRPAMPSTLDVVENEAPATRPRVAPFQVTRMSLAPPFIGAITRPSIIDLVGHGALCP